MSQIPDDIMRAIQMAEIISQQREGLPLSLEEEALINNWTAQGNSTQYAQLLDRQYIADELQQLQQFNDREKIAQLLRFAFDQPRKNAWYRWLRYLAIFAIVAFLAWYMWPTRETSNDIVVDKTIVPATDRAFLVSSDSSRVDLALIDTGKSFAASQTWVAKRSGGLIAYPSGTAPISSIDILQTPAGGTFSVVLSDGSRAWLNAASSITYPQKFSDTLRSVEVVGEVYFEVAQDEKAPFVVRLPNNINVEVLGSIFNTRARVTENTASVTLLEGALQLQHDGGRKASVIMQGQTAVYDLSDSTRPPAVSRIDTSSVMSWRHGSFNFSGQSFNNCMQEIGRWYNVEIIYEDEVPDIRLAQQISRQATYSDLLKFLKKAGVKFRAEENRRLVILGN